MSRAKFGPDFLKTMAVHKEQRNRQTHTQTDVFNFIYTRHYMLKLYCIVKSLSFTYLLSCLRQ